MSTVRLGELVTCDGDGCSKKLSCYNSHVCCAVLFLFNIFAKSLLSTQKQKKEKKKKLSLETMLEVVVQKDLAAVNCRSVSTSKGDTHKDANFFLCQNHSDASRVSAMLRYAWEGQEPGIHNTSLEGCWESVLAG